MHCTTYQRYTNTIGWLGRSKRNHREVTYSIVQGVGKVSVAVLDDEDGESKSVRLDAAVERVVATNIPHTTRCVTAAAPRNTAVDGGLRGGGGGHP